MAKIYLVVLLITVHAISAQGQTVPVPSHPADGATDLPTTVTLRWVPVLLATSYDVEISTISDFRTLFRNLTGIGATAVEVSGLSDGTTYYWRVRAVVTLVPGLWSSTSRFTTARSEPQPPDTPAHSSPSNEATGQPTTLTLDWNSASGADSYSLQVSTNSTFSSLVVDQSGITGTSREVSGLSPGTRHYWRVSAQNQAGSSGWSDAWSFTTRINPPAAPVLASPANGAKNQPSALTLDWNSSSGASEYSLQVSTSADIASPVIDESGLTETSREVTGLSTATTYYWRVRGENGGGTGSWSEIWNFTTRVASPNAPTLVSPLNGATDVPVPVTFAWDQVSGSDSYHLQVSRDGTFNTTDADESAITGGSHQLSGLSAGTRYHWRLRATNSSGSGAWSDAWGFTTADSDPGATYTLSTTIDFPQHENLSDYSPADYKIIGLPGASNAPLAEFLPGNAGQDWQAYWDNGRQSEYWVKYDGGPIFVFSVGRAFWILKRGPWVLNEVVPVPETNANRQVEIPLHGGWNLITSPYLTATLWPDVQQLNSTSEPLYQYVNGRYGNSGYLEPYTGYYYFNEHDLSTLLIPAEGSPGPPGRQAGQSERIAENEWKLNVEISNGSVTDDLLWVGSEEGASEGKDARDVHKPRPIAGFGSFFHRPEWDRSYTSFASDVRPPAETVQRWRFCIESEKAGEIQISLRGLEQLPAEFGVMLADEQSGALVDVRSVPHYTFFGDAGISTMSILIGRKSDITSAIPSIAVPEKLVLHSNFPNPFNPSTTIPFEVPEESTVRLVVHDLLGREIKTLIAGTIRSGRHRVVWDGRNDAGDAVPSGVYFCKLDVGGGSVLSRPMILAK